MTEQQGGTDDLGRGDDVYQPEAGGDREIREDTGPLEPADTLDDRGVDEVLDEGYSPPERPLAVEGSGTTGQEQRAGESLEERLARERPEREPPEGDGLGDAPDTDGELLDPEAGGSRSGRLVGPDEGAHARRDGVAGEDVGIDGGAASAEEAAVHLVADADLPDEELPDDDEDDAGR
ncbi:hypothetical protein RVR_903 [Actinacidiphila reveromycinica]|uniref:DUF5709 domain-containing protein n=1 Tax=Actinacidiphila reveromycinica TaxID=659352 RepID=A0A7U3UNN8_9ACTN|nr:DUF5709 domain-containing protein [Streptomyces sp. SN-593]BBA95868.1 hypothetical protein RVR_903 [Streptomyces sp. SN-593]